MDKPCCKGVVRDAAGLTGRTITIADVSCYVAGGGSAGAAADEEKTNADDQKKCKAAVIVFYDIFGGDIPNAKYIVDHIHRVMGDDVVVVLPDVYAHQNITAWTDATTLSTPEFGAWFGTVSSDSFWKQMNADVAAIAAWCKSECGAQKVGSIGFCWGGLASCGVTAATGVVDASVSHHGAGHNADHVNNSQCPQLYTSVHDDNYFNADAHAAVAAALKAKSGDVEESAGYLKVFDKPAYHGFVVRGDYDNNTEVKAMADDAMTRTCEFFSKHLL